MDEYIGKEALIASIESIDWYSVYRGKLTAGANSENALYKANDIYSAIDNIPVADVARFGMGGGYQQYVLVIVVIIVLSVSFYGTRILLILETTAPTVAQR